MKLTVLCPEWKRAWRVEIRHMVSNHQLQTALEFSEIGQQGRFSFALYNFVGLTPHGVTKLLHAELGVQRKGVPWDIMRLPEVRSSDYGRVVVIVPMDPPEETERRPLESPKLVVEPELSGAEVQALEQTISAFTTAQRVHMLEANAERIRQPFGERFPFISLYFQAFAAAHTRPFQPATEPGPLVLTPYDVVQVPSALTAGALIFDYRP